MARNSQAERDGLIKQLISMPVGATGLDARGNDAAVLRDLVNARFADPVTAERRNGHDGLPLQGEGTFDPTDTVTDVWSYGYGLIATTEEGGQAKSGTHYPIAGKGMGVFTHEGTEVGWTGDRLIVGDKEQRAYLPTMVDSPFEIVGGTQADVCPFETKKAIAVAVEEGGIMAVILDSNGLAIHQQVVGQGTVTKMRLVKAGEDVLLLFLDDNGFQLSRWTGAEWNTPSIIEAECTTFDVSTDDTGCVFIWDHVDGVIHTAKAGDFHNGSPGTQFSFGSDLDLSGYTLNTFVKLAVSISPSGRLAYAFTSDGRTPGDGGTAPAGLYVSTCAEDLTVASEPVQLSADALYLEEGGNVTIAWRQLSYGSDDTNYQYAVYANPAEQYTAAAADEDNVVMGWALMDTGEVEETFSIHNARIMSTAFNIGHETFVWMKSLTSTTAFLLGGVETHYRCAMADREETEFDEVTAFTPLRHVQKTGEHTALWARPYRTGGYFRRGDIKVGEMNFLPAMSTARYGNATYVMGSLVRAWDGFELGDAGFHDYPVVISLTEAAGTMVAGTYQLRVYPVRYTSAGERMKGVGAVSATITTVSPCTVEYEVATMPLTNHTDVKLEVYMAYAGRTEFRLVDVLDNDTSVHSVSADVGGLSLNDWLLLPADEHAPAVGVSVSLESFGPLGCSVLCTSGDRLWGSGGQVPAGLVQFSKRYEVNQAAGFSDITSTQVLDATGSEITSLASFSDSALVAFKRDGFYTMLGEGPDNFGNGSYDSPNLSVVSGAVNHQGTKATPVGVFYWAPEGPRVLTSLNRTEYVGEPIRPLAEGETPTGVRVELDKSEVIWYTDNGAALLLNFAGPPRWARWTGVPTAGACDTALVTPNGELWYPTESELDAGRSFSFWLETGNIRLEKQLQAGHRLIRVGLSGKWLGPHRVRMNVYYDGSPDWLERMFWTPADSSWLVLIDDWADLTPAEIDELNIVDQTGRYDLLARVSRQDCAHVRLVVSDLGTRGFLPQNISLEIASKNAPTRLAAQTIQRSGE